MHPANALRSLLRLLAPVLLCLGAVTTLYLAISVMPVSAGTPSFDARRAFGTGTDHTQAVAVGDMDGDGDLDIAVGNEGQPSAVYLNDGTGNFPTARNFGTVSDKPRSVVAADMNGDGRLDIAVGNEGQQNVVYLNAGEAIFTTSNPIPFGPISGTVRSVAVGDMDGDGHFDVVAGNGIYLNKTGTFTTTTAVPFGLAAGATKSVALADMDLDGDLDIVAGYADGQQNRVYVNESMTFSQAIPYGAGPEKLESIVVGDMDRDSRLDIVADYTQQFGSGYEQNWVYLNKPKTVTNTTPSFAEMASYASVTDLINSIAVGDMDGDGYLDIVAANVGQPHFVYLNDGKGAFPDERKVSVGAGTDRTGSVAVGDMDRDGHLDIVVVDNYENPNAVYLNDGTGNFPAGREFGREPAKFPEGFGSVAVGDMNGDGRPDIIAGDYGQGAVYLNDETGEFPTDRKRNFGLPYDGTTARSVLAVGHLNRDRYLDIVVGNTRVGATGKQNAVYLNDGTATFTKTLPFGPVEGSQSLAIGDMDGDADLDIVAGNAGHQNAVYLNDGTGTFTTTSSIPFGPITGTTQSIVVGDMDSDGDLDIVAGNAGQQNVLYLNEGAKFTGSRPFGTAPDSTNSVALGDMDGDGDLDVVDGNNGLNMVYLNDGAGDFPVGRGFGVEGDVTLAVAVGDMDGDGDLDIVAGDSFTQQSAVYLNDGLGNFPTRLEVGKQTDQTESIALGDMDADGDLDIVVGVSPIWHNPPHLPEAKHGRQYNVMYMNGRVSNMGGLPNNPPFVAGVHPESPDVELESPPAILDTPIITISYTLSDTERDRVAFICAWYSQDGGDHWQKAVATKATETTNLAPGKHEFGWVTFPPESYDSRGEPAACRNPDVRGFFGLSDNVVFRFEAYPDLHPMTNTVPGPYQHPYASATTLPFRVRGTQVQVFENGGGAGGATVYRFSEGQTRVAQPIGSAGGLPFMTDGHGYLQGRGSLKSGDSLVALLPISGTGTITNTGTYTLYHTSATPTAIGVAAYPVTTTGVLTMAVSSAHPLLLLNLDVSLEWDARKDLQFLSQLRYDLGRTSELLYDWSNGQAALGQVNVYQDREHWDDADIRIYASNRLRPNAAQGGIVAASTTDPPNTDPAKAKIVYEPGQVRMGAVWNRYGESSGTLGEDWPRALAHELGHYAFFLQDTYLGLNASGQVVSVDGCPGAMSDPYRDDYGEFFNPATFLNVQWSNACGSTLAARETGRWDWQTINTFYRQPSTGQPWLNGTADLAGPTVLPLAVTQITVTDPVTTTRPVDVPIFSLTGENGARVLPGPSARAVLYQREREPGQGERLTDLGSPTLDQVIARGAWAGDELCVYEPGAARMGCRSVNPTDRELQLYKRSDWEPGILVTPVTSRTITIDVQDLPVGYNLRARLYPADSAAPAEKPLARNGSKYTVVFGPTDLAEPVAEGYVRVWVDEPQPGRREAFVDFTLGGDPAHKRSSHAHKRSSHAPVTSADGQVILFAEGLQFPEGEFYSIQALAQVRNAPSWATVAGQGYRLTKSAAAPSLAGASLSVSYLADDVAPGEEQWIRLYYSEDGASWRQLPTDLDTYYNMATARVQDAGWYALMSSIEIELPYKGWNMFAYPIMEPRPVAEALQSIAGLYTAVFDWFPTNVRDPYRGYFPPVPGSVTGPQGLDCGVKGIGNSWSVCCLEASDSDRCLGELQFGRGYWIYVTQPNTILRLKGSAYAGEE